MVGAGPIWIDRLLNARPSPERVIHVDGRWLPDASVHRGASNDHLDN